MPAEALSLAAALLCAAPGGGEPSIEIRPERVVLGSGERARVVVRSPGGEPRLSASAGTLGPLREVEPGVFLAALEPPAETWPQLAIVSALSPAGAAFAVLPLVGRGVAVARTAPLARITVEIEGRVFGPAHANRGGVAEVDVEVPPGVTYARHRGKPIDLHVPPLRQVHLTALPAAVRADREEVVRLYAFAATPRGAPWQDAPFELVASAGRLGPAAPIAPGAVAVDWTLPPGAAGPVSVEARVGAGPPARLALERPAGPPARVALRLAAPRASAGDPPIEIAAEAVDAAGNPAGEATLAASFGELSAPARDGRGAVRASLRIPERLEGRSSAVVEARAGEAVARAAIALSAASPARVAVRLEPAELTADGHAASEVTVSVTDRFGNGVEEPAPALEARRGAIAPPTRVGPGAFRARYAPAWLREGGVDAVVARAGSLVDEAVVRLRAAPRQLGVTVRAGALRMEGVTAPWIGAAVEAWPPRLGGWLGASLGVGRAAASRSDAAPGPGGPHSVDSATVLWPIEATALARRRLSPRVVAEAGAGLRAVRVVSTVALDGVRTADEAGWAPGAHAIAGAALELPRWHARARLDAVVAWQDDPGMRSFRGALRTWGLALGVTHDAL